MAGTLLRAAIDDLANQLCVAVDGNFDFAVRASMADETLEKLSMLINFVLDTARRGMSALEERNEALAEIDRAKTAFFNNVSHEFRTPLTLILGPLEDVLAGRHGTLADPLRQQIEVTHRNATRLLRLVNGLLEFSRLAEARSQPAFAPCDLAGLTAEVAVVFREVIERAGLRLVVDCPPLPEPVHVDRQMWETIVLNLLSNAFKFTFEGDIRVSLRPNGDSVELTVRDTGIGIPTGEHAHLFKRFHRVPGARSRSHEGTGIGLALVQELVRAHGGTITVESAPGSGSAFRVVVPTRTEHLPKDGTGARGRSDRDPTARAAFVDEAQRWLPEGREPLPTPTVVGDAAAVDGARILVVDDNADMRDHLRRLLGTIWRVDTAPDGATALEAARRDPPDLVLADVMMPGLDGFGLLRALRGDSRTREVPVVMLSARAGEEATVESLDAGADDYLVKPFSRPELVARVRSQLSFARARRAIEEQRTALLAREQEARREAERQREKAHEESQINETLYRLSAAFARQIDRQTLVQMITDESTRLAGAEFGAFFLNVTDPRGGAYLLYTLSGAPKEVFARFPLPRATPLFAPTFRGESIVRLDDVRQDPRFGKWGPQPHGHLPVVSYLAVPVVAQSGEVFGGLFFGHGQPGRFTASHERIVAGIAAQAAVALERSRLYGELRDSETRVRLAVESSELGTWDYDAGRDVMRWSERCCELFGVSQSADRNYRSFLDRVHPEDRERVDRLSREAMDPGGSGAYLAEYRTVPDASGAERWIASRGQVFFDEARRPLRFLGTIRDITEEKRAAAVHETLVRELRDSEERARQAYELAREADRRKDEFLAMLGHELRNPLAPILTALQLMSLRERGESPKALAIIERQVRHLVRLVDDLLDVSRITRGKVHLNRERLEVASIVAKAVEMASPLLEQRTHTLTIDVPREGLSVDGDPVRLAQVVANLLTNAAKYTEPGGHIAVSAGRSGEAISISVKDDGQGIPADLLPHVFDLFVQGRRTSERSQGGLGIGLTLIRTLTQLHGGTVTACSDGPDRGSEFVIRLPAAAAESRPPQEAPRTSAPPEPIAADSGARILLVDDNLDAAQVLAEALRRLGHQVRVAYDGPQALAIATSFPATTALLDLGLPVMDGYELAKRLRAVWAARPVQLVAITGYGQDADKARTREAGFDRHLVKPVDLSEIVALLDEGDRSAGGSRRT